MIPRKYFIFTALVCFVLLTLSCSKNNSNPSNPNNNSDTEKPTVNILLPAMDAMVKGDSLYVSVTASDNVGVTSINLYFDNVIIPIATLLTAPYNVTLPITQLSFGLHSVIAKAYDSAGNASNISNHAFTRVDPAVLSMKLRAGSQFVFDRSDLDASNNPITSTHGTYTSVISNGTGAAFGSYSDWMYDISTDTRLSRIDTLILRTNENSDVMVYGFVTNTIARMAGGLSQGSLNGNLPDPTWDYVGKFNSDPTTPLSIGSSWDITPSSGVSVSVTVSGTTVPLTIKLKGQLASRADVFTVNGKTIHTWKVVVTASITALIITNTVTVNLWFSDDPSGQIRYQQDYANFNFITTQIPVTGDLEVLKSFQ